MTIKELEKNFIEKGIEFDQGRLDNFEEWSGFEDIGLEKIILQNDFKRNKYFIINKETVKEIKEEINYCFSKEKIKEELKFEKGDLSLESLIKNNEKKILSLSINKRMENEILELNKKDLTIFNLENILSFKIGKNICIKKIKENEETIAFELNSRKENNTFFLDVKKQIENILIQTQEKKENKNEKEYFDFNLKDFQENLKQRNVIGELINKLKEACLKIKKEDIKEKYTLERLNGKIKKVQKEIFLLKELQEKEKLTFKDIKKLTSSQVIFDDIKFEKNLQIDKKITLKEIKRNTIFLKSKIMIDIYKIEEYRNL